MPESDNLPTTTAVYHLPGFPVAIPSDPLLKRVWTVGYQGNFQVTIVLDDAEREIDIDDRDAQIHFYLQMWDTGPLGLYSEIKRVRLVLQQYENITIGGARDTLDVVLETDPLASRTLWSTTGDILPMADFGQPPLEKPRVIHRQLTVQTGIFTTKPPPLPPNNQPAPPIVPAPSATPGLKYIDVHIDYVMRSDRDPNTTETERLSLVFYVSED